MGFEERLDFNVFWLPGVHYLTNGFVGFGSQLHQALTEGDVPFGAEQLY